MAWACRLECCEVGPLTDDQAAKLHAELPYVPTQPGGIVYAFEAYLVDGGVILGQYPFYVRATSREAAEPHRLASMERLAAEIKAKFEQMHIEVDAQIAARRALGPS